MYLFQPLTATTVTADGLNLHSTMYLFQLSKPLKIIRCPVFTFHYVSISTLPHLTEISTSMSFTFHYVSISTTSVARCFFVFFDLHSTMYLFQPKSALLRIFIIRIYIPLCIYFNCFPSHSAGACKYLHSTMYLFQRISAFICEPSSRIYIPLCIYFNSFRPHLSIAKSYLHSTMYLFQLFQGTNSSLDSVFTFHYVSISTRTGTAILTILPLFTFHYVSIST